MIDLARDEADRRRSRARRPSRAQGGATWSELNDADGRARARGDRRRHLDDRHRGLTLGGGLGWLMAKHGLAADNLLARRARHGRRRGARRRPPSRIPTCSGRFAAAAATSASRRRSRTGCIRCTMIVGGLIAHPIDAAADLLRFYRDAVAARSDELTVFAGLVHAPDGSGHEARSADRLPHRRPGRGRARAGAVQEWGSPLMVEVGADAVSRDEHAARRRVSRPARSTTGSRASPAGSPTS